jgi:hypothetical protein
VSTLIVFTAKIFAQSAHLSTNRARVSIQLISDNYDSSEPKLKVLRTDKNTPLFTFFYFAAKVSLSISYLHCLILRKLHFLIQQIILLEQTIQPNFDFVLLSYLFASTPGISKYSILFGINHSKTYKIALDYFICTDAIRGCLKSYT